MKLTSLEDVRVEFKQAYSTPNYAHECTWMEDTVIIPSCCVTCGEDYEIRINSHPNVSFARRNTNSDGAQHANDYEWPEWADHWRFVIGNATGYNNFVCNNCGAPSRLAPNDGATIIDWLCKNYNQDAVRKIYEAARFKIYGNQHMVKYEY